MLGTLTILKLENYPLSEDVQRNTEARAGKPCYPGIAQVKEHALLEKTAESKCRREISVFSSVEISSFFDPLLERFVSSVNSCAYPPHSKYMCRNQGVGQYLSDNL